jgi:hypothetical protein
MMSMGSYRLSWFKRRMQEKSFPAADVSANFAGLRGRQNIVMHCSILLVTEKRIREYNQRVERGAEKTPLSYVLHLTMPATFNYLIYQEGKGSALESVVEVECAIFKKRSFR